MGPSRGLGINDGASVKLDLALVGEPAVGSIEELRTNLAATNQLGASIGTNVVGLDGRRTDVLSPATVNMRLAAISGLYSFRSMRDPDISNPVPKGREAKRLSAGERTGMLVHVSRAPKRRSPLRVRDTKRLPKTLDHREVIELLESLRTWRDRAIAGLMVFCGLRSAEVLALNVGDVDIGARWL